MKVQYKICIYMIQEFKIAALPQNCLYLFLGFFVFFKIKLLFFLT